MRRLPVALALGILAALGADAGEDPPPCLVSAVFDPPAAVVGQQVHYRLRILSDERVADVEWIDPPAFPGFRAERLPGSPDSGSEQRGSVLYRVRTEERALFAQRAGDLAPGPARLGCRRVDAPGAGPYVADVPTAILRVEPLPERGRPTGFGDLVGPLFVQSLVEPREIALGGSVRVAVTLGGSGNLWAARGPLTSADLDGAELFARRPRTEIEAGVTLSVRRHFEYEVVPRRTGPLVIPALRVAYFDPDSGRYAEATAPSVTIAVGESASGD